MGFVDGLLWGGLFRIFVAQHVTWCVNSVCHVFGSRPFDTRDDSRNNWLLAHAGSAEKEKYIQTVKTFENTFLEICFSRAPKGMIESFVDEGLEDRVLFGSDADFMSAPQQIGRVLFAEVNEEIKKKILCDNPRKVFNLEP